MLRFLIVPAVMAAWLAFLVSRAFLLIWIDERADIARKKRIRERRFTKSLVSWTALPAGLPVVARAIRADAAPSA